MSIFTKPLAQVAFGDLQELLENSAVENVRLEFKSEIPEKKELLKKISSFANTFGGFVVIGAKADSTDGKLVALPGVVPQNSYKQQVIQWSFDGASPPLVVEVSDAIQHAAERGRVFYVISVHESDVAPHFLNERKGVWIRTDEFSQRYEPQLANENELKHLLERRREVLERRVQSVSRSQRRFDRLRSRPSSGNETLAGAAARIELSIGPRFPARPLGEQSQLARALQSCRINWRQVWFPYTGAKFVSQHESALFLTPSDARNRCGIIEANIWGMLFYGTELEIELGPNQTTAFTNTVRGIHLYRLVGYLLVFIEHARKMLSGWSYRGSLSIDVAMKGVLGIPWLYSENNVGVDQGPGSELDDDFSFSIPTTSDEVQERPDALVMNMLHYILFAMNWSELANKPEELEALLWSGYRYNFWEKAALRV